MLRDMRESYGLTRQELADQTHRSVGYLLKAEQATFPSFPMALLDFYVKRGHDPDILRSAYRDYQRRQRRAWLETWEPEPYTAGRPFRQKWFRRPLNWVREGEVTGLAETDADLLSGADTAVGLFRSKTGFFDNYGVYSEPFIKVAPSSYAISVGLCLPAAVVYRNDKDLTKAGSIQTALSDLLEYYESGQGLALAYDEWLVNAKLVEALRRLALEEGLELDDTAPVAGAA